LFESSLIRFLVVTTTLLCAQPAEPCAIYFSTP